MNQASSLLCRALVVTLSEWKLAHSGPWAMKNLNSLGVVMLIRVGQWYLNCQADIKNHNFFSKDTLNNHCF